MNIVFEIKRLAGPAAAKPWLSQARLAARLELACRGAARTRPPVEFLPAPVQVSTSEYKRRNI
jgi:hypothetical protein